MNDDHDNFFKWQQNRIRRKLEIQRELYQFNLSQLLNQNLNTPLTISSVSIQGATTTRYSFLASIINPIISENDNDSTLKHVLNATSSISTALKNTNIFSNIHPTISFSKDPLAAPTDVDLIFKTKERGRLRFATNTEIGSNNEGSASVSLRVHNLFGGAEILEANAATGNKTRQSFRALLSVPLSSDMLSIAELSAYATERDLAYASCSETLRGSKLAISHRTSNAGKHELAYEAVSRHIASLLPTASLSIRAAAGTSLKSALTHSFVLDTRDDRVRATRGAYFRLAHELAGFGGDAHFYKAEVEAQASRSLWDTGLSVSLSGRSGFLWALGRSGSLFPDRFQLGGPTSLRGFNQHSLGPKHGDDSIGGELFYSAGLSAFSNIPKKPHWPLKLHAWLNAGRLDSLHQDAPLRASVLSALSAPSVSVGLGFLVRLDPARVEINFGVPLVASRSDGIRRGFQAGIGIEFL